MRPLHLAQPRYKSTIWEALWINRRMNTSISKDNHADRADLNLGTISLLQGQTEGCYHRTAVLSTRRESKGFAEKRRLIFLALQA
jgi:hypothetical protein